MLQTAFLKKKYLQDTRGNPNGKQQTFRCCHRPEWNPKTLALLSPLNSLILPLTGAYLFMLLLVILYGRSLSHAVPAYCLLVLPWEKFVPMKKGGVTDTPHQHHYHHIARLILTSKKGSFNDIVHLSHWLKVGGWEGGGYGKGVGWGLLVGTRGEGYCWGERGESIGAAGLTGGKKKKKKKTLSSD